jgi:hypothetical protein
MSVSQNPNVAYCLNQPYARIFPSPIVSKRAPLTTDKAQIGTVWVQSSANSAWILTSIVANSATWEAVSGGGGSFSTLTVTGNSTLGSAAGSTVTLGNLSGATEVLVDSGTAGTTFNSSGEIGFISTLTGTIAVSLQATDASGQIYLGSGGLTTIDGVGGVLIESTNAALTLSSGTGTIAISGDATNTTVGLGTGAGAKLVTVGSTTTSSTLTLKTPTGTPVVAANGLTATVGNITATNGNIVLSTATNLIQLPGPVNIMSGAGAPSAGLALHVGDMYINTTAASATTRIYVATAASNWTNVTCAA